jgi:hypothetical protein
MLSYMDQVAICNSAREGIKRALAQSEDPAVRLKVHKIPATESILRAVTLIPSVDTKDKLKDFIIEHVLGVLNIAGVQREHLNLNG